MPTVGCEADAIAFTEEHSGGDSSNSGGSSSGSSSICEVMAVRADGSYNTGKSCYDRTAITVSSKQVF